MRIELENKKIVLSVSGGIAAYKSIELLRILQKAGADVKVIMTKNALSFISPLTFEVISGHKVLTNLFDRNQNASISHIELAKNCDAAVIAPATANIIGKLANGIADDAVTTFMLAVTAPKILCPSMNTNMYENRIVQRNIERLEADGYIIVEPSEGELACKTIGHGRLPSPEKIADRIIKTLTVKDLKGKKILVSAGPTREHIDPVRFISNPSSGKMGYAIASAAERRGADVTLVSGTVALSAPEGVNVIRILSASQMAESIFAHANTSDIIIKTAAVSDYSPVECFDHKIKKSNDVINLTFNRNIDILKEIGAKKNEQQIIVGFAAETEELEKNASKKLAEKNLDMIVGNIVGEYGSGFEYDTNRVTFFYKDNSKEKLEEMTKYEMANILLDRIINLIES